MRGCFLAICLLATLAGCGGPPTPPLAHRVGQKCEVQFRRDALGTAAALPVSPKTDEINGASVHLRGTLKKAYPDSLLIADEGNEYLIPLHAVLYVEFESAKK